MKLGKLEYCGINEFDRNLGIWAVTTNQSSSSTKFEGIFNFVSTDNFFLKTLGKFFADEKIICRIEWISFK